jgi:glycosyltransferase involved in cell wall biosynthesis
MAEVVVLIPHYNDPKGLENSLASINEKEPVDIVVVDDGSTLKLDIDRLTSKYRGLKLTVINLNSNQGIENALNQGLQFILGKEYKYIARLDCGDICYAGRFMTQKKFLEDNPDICLVGTWVDFIDMRGNKVFTFQPPTHHEKIKLKMFLNNMFCHPSIMFRVQAVEKIGFYPTVYKAAEDYAFFFRFIKHCKTANIPIVLLKYEVNPSGISLSKRRQQIQSRLHVIMDNFYWGFHPIYGLVRNFMIGIIPFFIIDKLKRRHF